MLTKRLVGAAASTDVQEVALIGMTAYLAYLAGDVFGLSGILAIFVCAVAISHYALHNISGRWLGTGQREERQLERRPRWKPSRRLPSNVESQGTRQSSHARRCAHPSTPACSAAESRTTTIYAFHTLSYISEGMIFVYCGLDALDPLKWQVRCMGLATADCSAGMRA